MSESLDTSEKIGGVFVDIGVNLDQLKAAKAQAKEIAKEIEATPIKVRLVADTSGLQVAQSEIQKVVSGSAGLIAGSTAGSSTAWKMAVDSSQITQAVQQTETLRKVLVSTAEAAKAAIPRGVYRAYDPEHPSGIKPDSGSKVVAEDEDAGGGGGRGGSRGGWAQTNFLSARGLGRLTGSLAAVVAIDEGLKIATSMLQAKAVEGNYQKILDEHSTYAYDASQGGGIETAKAIASSDATLMRVDAAKSVPVVGTITEFIDSLSGASTAIKKNRDDLEETLKARATANQSYIADEKTLLIETGQRVRAVQEETALAVAEKTKIALHAGKDSKAIDDLNVTKQLGQISEARAIFEESGRKLAVDTSVDNAVLQGTILWAERDGDAHAQVVAENAQRMNTLIEAQSKEVGDHLDDPNLGEIGKRQRIDLSNERKAEANRVIDADRETQAKLTAVETEGAAERIRVTQSEYAAKQYIIQASVAAEITAARGFRQTLVAVEAGASKLYANFVDNVRTLATDEASTKAVVDTAQYLIDNDQQKAQLSQFDADAKARVDGLRHRYGDNSQQVIDEGIRDNAQRAVITAGQARANATLDQVSQAHLDANKLRIADKPQQASIVERDAQALAAINNASPEDRPRLAKEALSNMEVAKHDLMRAGGGGGDALAVNVGEVFTLVGGSDSDTVGGQLGQLTADMGKARQAAVAPPPSVLPGFNGADNSAFGPADALSNLIDYGNKLLERVATACENIKMGYGP